MRWATYTSPTVRADRVGLLHEGEIRGLREPAALIDLLGDDGTRLADAAGRALRDPLEVITVESAVLRAPIPRPPAVRDFAAFEEHIATWLGTLGRTIHPDWYDRPIFYFQNPAAICGPGDIPIAPGSRKFDFELEFAAIIGREGAHLAPEEAANHIAGYTILCDWSARDIQEQEMVHLAGAIKSKDTATSIGPYLVTPDELEPYRTDDRLALDMKAFVNGRQYSQGSLSSVHWTFPEMLTYASRGTRLFPGDVIGTGTVGTGCLLELTAVHGEKRYPWLSPGDEVMLEVQGIGTLEHRIVAGSEPIPVRRQT